MNDTDSLNLNEILSPEEVTAVEENDPALFPHTDAYSPFRVGTEALLHNDVAWEQYVQQINKLPEPVKNLLMDISTIQFLMRLGKEYGLSEWQSEQLSGTIREILFGSVQLSAFSSILQTRLQIEPTLAAELARDITSELLLPSLGHQNQPTAIKPNPSTQTNPGIRQLNRQPASQEGETDHIINLRDEQS